MKDHKFLRKGGHCQVARLVRIFLFDRIENYNMVLLLDISFCIGKGCSTQSRQVAFKKYLLITEHFADIPVKNERCNMCRCDKILLVL